MTARVAVGATQGLLAVLGLVPVLGRVVVPSRVPVPRRVLLFRETQVAGPDRLGTIGIQGVLPRRGVSILRHRRFYLLALPRVLGEGVIRHQQDDGDRK